MTILKEGIIQAVKKKGDLGQDKRLGSRSLFAVQAIGEGSALPGFNGPIKLLLGKSFD